jgi:hypothetical protein
MGISKATIHNSIRTVDKTTSKTAITSTQSRLDPPSLHTGTAAAVVHPISTPNNGRIQLHGHPYNWAVKLITKESQN